MDRLQRLEAMLEAARRGERAGVRAFVSEIAPILQARIARVLLRRSEGRSIRTEIEDLVQESLVVLFSNDAQVLRRWDPTRGLSLENYVGMIAERRASSKLRSRKRNPWTEEPTAEADLPIQAQSSPERRVASKHLLDLAIQRLRAELSSQAFRLFELLWIEERSTEEIQSELGMSRDAIYTAKRRIRKVAAAIASELEEAEVEVAQ